jgi:uncharacterized protein (DUF2141 family)
MAFYINPDGGDQKQMVTLICEGLESSKGFLMVAIFDKESNFLGKEMFLAEKIPVSAKGEITLSIQLPKGTYAAAVYHDENGNGKLDRNMFYYPTEVYGFSNNARGVAGPPSWSDSKFTVENDLKLRIRLQ